MADIVVSHGIRFIRHGSCTQCGACGCNKVCPHYYSSDGKSWCSIYDKREEVCPVCSTEEEEIMHESCIGYPDNPWITLVRNGTCSFWFEREDAGSMDDILFLNGEPYRID